MVTLSKVEDSQDIGDLRTLIEKHAATTRSARAETILKQWAEHLPKFVKVLPKDYARVLAALRRVRESGLSGDEAVMAAFEENTRDAARVGGG
jgi:glutamate synthase (ferredoxin)